MEMMVNEKKNTRHDGITVQPANMLSCYIYKIYGYFIQPPVAQKKKKMFSIQHGSAITISLSQSGSRSGWPRPSESITSASSKAFSRKNNSTVAEVLKKQSAEIPRGHVFGRDDLCEMSYIKYKFNIQAQTLKTAVLLSPNPTDLLQVLAFRLRANMVTKG